MGKMMHGEVMEFFKEIPFHLFISLSESEGLPVSMMEAISFGIPILSTDVGGVKEIVTKETGVLVEPSINHEDIASIIDDWKLTGLSSEIFRQGVRRFWEENFSAATNYPAFIKELKDLHCD
jgi:glycosyltransferase involved in cell wall biosynthesis